MRSSLADALPSCARALGKCVDDPYVVEIINEAQQRLLPMGKWVKTYQHYRFCARSGCITLPRQLETIEAYAACGWPHKIRNEWFEFVSDGFGLRDNCVSSPQDKGEGWVAFEDVTGANKKLRVYSDKVEAADATILLQFWNENGLPVRSEDPVGSGNWIDGEKVAISTTQTNSINTCAPNGLVAVQKPITKGTVFLYEYDTVATTQRLLAMYEPDETRPNYRRYVIPLARQSNGTEVCDSEVVDIIAKLRFIPARLPTDWLLIGNIPALKMACMAIQKEENSVSGAFEAAVYWYGGTLVQKGQVTNIRGAKGILDDELNQFLGDGAQAVIQINDDITNGAVCNMI